MCLVTFFKFKVDKFKLFFERYSYGEPVKGTAHVRIALNHHLYDVDTYQFPHFQEKLQLDNGAAIFESRIDNFVSFVKL